MKKALFPVNNFMRNFFKQSTLFCLLALLLSTVRLYSQQVVSVDPSSGSALINVPIYTVQSGPISHPISIGYRGNGLKSDAVTGRMGNGWNLYAGGFIHRVVNGLPDDYKDERRLGWLANSGSVADSIGGFAPQADDNLLLIDDEGADYDFLESLGGFDLTSAIKDTEPDIFEIIVPGLRATFVFDHNGEIAFMGKNNWKILYALNEKDEIIGFTITTDQGVQYVFDEIVKSNIRVEGELPEFFKRGYYTFSSDSIDQMYYSTNYNAMWHLTSIRSANGEFIQFEYLDFKDSNQLNTITPNIYPTYYLSTLSQGYMNHDVFLYNKESGKYDLKEQYKIKDLLYANRLSKIITNRQEVQFVNDEQILPQGEYIVPETRDRLEHTEYPEHAVSILNKINIVERNDGPDELLKQFIFKYKPLKSSDNEDRFTHLLLRSITESSIINQNPPYNFEYHGVDFDGQTIQFTERGTGKKDIFGFYNLATKLTGKPPYVFHYPDLSGVDRYRYAPIPYYTNEVMEIPGSHSNFSVHDLASMMVGSLKSVKYPMGGEVSIEYEPNSYYDSIAQRNAYGGGLRVKRLITSDGYNRDGDMRTNFYYESGSGRSSGVLLRQPMYSFSLNSYKDPITDATTYLNAMGSFSAEERFKSLMVRSKEDMDMKNSNGASVGYSVFTQEQEGIGKKEMHFDLPISYRTESHQDWLANRTKVARKVPTGTYEVQPIGDITGAFKYPFAYQPGFSGQGLLVKELVFDADDNLLEEIKHEYEVTPAENYVKGLVIDKHLYPMRIYNPNTSSWSMEDMPYFIYTAYQLDLGRTVRRTKTIAKSYEIASGNFSEVTSRFLFQSPYHDYITHVIKEAEGVRHESIIKYPQDYLMGPQWAALDLESKTLSKLINKRMFYTPVEELTYQSTNGGPTLVSASLSKFYYDKNTNNVGQGQVYMLQAPVDSSQFVISHIKDGNEFVFDSIRYRAMEKFDHFNDFGIPQTVSYFNKQTNSTHLDALRRTKISIGNAGADEVLFTDFEQGSDYGLSFNKGLYEAVQTPAGRLEGSGFSIKPGVDYALSGSLINKGNIYIVSYWLKGALGGSIDVTFVDNTNSVVVGQAFEAHDDWKYYELTIDGSSLSEQTNVVIQTTTEVLIDDITIKPEHAVTAHYLYRNFRKIAETSNEKFLTTEYDAIGRPIYHKDEQANIIKAYQYAENLLPTWEPNIIFNTNIFSFSEATITAVPAKIAEIQYRWKLTSIPNHSSSEFEMGIIENVDFSGSPVDLEGNFIHTFTDTVAAIYILQLEVDYLGVKRHTYARFTVGPPPLVASICSSLGQAEDIYLKYDACNPGENPGCVTADPGDLVFKVSVEGGSGNYTYEWTRWRYGQSHLPEALQETGPVLHLGSFLNQNYMQYRCRITDVETNQETNVGFFIQSFVSDPTCTNEISE